MIFRKQILFFLVALFFVQHIIAQGGAVIKASVDKNKILIGEPLQLTIETYFSPEAVIKPIHIDSIEHFEFLEKPVTDTIDKQGGLSLRNIYKLTSFDSGHWVIPSFVLSAAAKTDTIPMDVVFSDFDPNQDYHDVKDILEVNPEKRKEWWWYIVAGILLITVVVIYLLRKKKPVLQVKLKTVIDPYDEAMKQLEQLQRSKAEVKQYYSQLIDIFRLYVFRKKGILSLQKTTDDLVMQLRSLVTDKEQFNKLSQALRLSDFVKFAKYVPSGDDDINCFNEIRNSIIAIEKLVSVSSSFGGK